MLWHAVKKLLVKYASWLCDLWRPISRGCIWEGGTEGGGTVDSGNLMEMYGTQCSKHVRRRVFCRSNPSPTSPKSVQLLCETPRKWGSNRKKGRPFKVEEVIQWRKALRSKLLLF